MVETISPVGYGDRTGRWLSAVALHAIGATATAAAFGALLGGAGALLGAPWGVAGLGLVALVALLYAAREAFGLPIPVPAARLQVPDWWRSFFSWPVAALLYGAGLGIGFLTFLTHGGLVVVAVAAAASGRPLAGAALLGVFGLARGLSPLVAWSVRTSEAGSAMVDRLATANPDLWRLLNAAVLAAVAGAAGVQLVRVAAAAPMGSVRDGLAAAAVALLAVAFGGAAAAKLADRDRWRRTLAGYGLPAGIERSAAAGVPGAELGVAVLVAAGLAPAAAGVALALLAAFSVAIMRARARNGDEVACGCFGGRGARDYRVLLARNAGLALLAVAGAAAATPHGWPGAPTRAEVLPFLLATTGLLVAGLTAWRAGAWMSRGRRV